MEASPAAARGRQHRPQRELESCALGVGRRDAEAQELERSAALIFKSNSSRLFHQSGRKMAASVCAS